VESLRCWVFAPLGGSWLLVELEGGGEVVEGCRRVGGDPNALCLMHVGVLYRTW